MKRLQERSEESRADPFAPERLPSGFALDRSRDLAMIYQASESDFPGLLDFAGFDVAEGERVWDAGLLGPMLRRWCDFAPEAALIWVRANVTEGSDGWDPFSASGSFRESFEALVAEEALDDRPDWALELMETILVREKARQQDEPDPFGDASDPFGGSPFSGLRSDEFLYSYVQAHPERAGEVLEMASAELAEWGFEGWAAAMIELGREAEVEGALLRFPSELREQLQASFLEELVAQRPERAREIMEGESTSADWDLARWMWGEHGGDEAVAWYLARATSAEERAERVGRVAATPIIGDFEEAVRWVEARDAEGVDTSGAYVRLTDQAVSDDDAARAYGLLDRVDALVREEVLAEILDREIHRVRVWVENESMDVYHAAPGAVERAQAAGYDAQLLSLVRERNAEHWEKFADWLGQLDEEWQDIAPEAHPSSSAPE